MRKSITMLIAAVCLLTALIGVASAKNPVQINIATVTSPELVHTRSALWF